MTTHVSDLVERALELERRDTELEAAIAHLVGLSERLRSVREEAVDVCARLDAIPELLAEARRSHDHAVDEQREAVVTLGDAEVHVAQLEHSRRKREAEIDQANRELTRAREARRDAEAKVKRLGERIDQVAVETQEIEKRAKQVVAAAERLGADIGTTDRVPDAGKEPPPARASGIEAWGGQTRAALFVARGGLDAERERLIGEANLLGATALGEPLGTTSVTLVRQHLERL